MLMNLASSANNNGITVLHLSGRSFMKTKKSKGHKILPWGTPLVTFSEFDISPFTRTT